MKIFITGIAGFIGSHLADYLIDQGHEVYGNDNLFFGNINNINKNVKKTLINNYQNQKVITNIYYIQLGYSIKF
jgi:nucleoside-diphosphate-sugar epimerase